jgi:hypothetical protein
MVPFGDYRAGRSAAGCGERRCLVFTGSAGKAAGWPTEEKQKAAEGSLQQLAFR